MARSTRRSQDFSQQGPLMRLTHLLDSSVYCQPLKPEPLASVEKRWRALGDQALAVSVICEAEVLYGIELKGSAKLNLLYQDVLHGRLQSKLVDREVVEAFALAKASAKACQRRSRLNLSRSVPASAIVG